MSVVIYLQDSVDHDIDLTADAYVIVYSVIDRSTFDAAVQNLYKLRHVIGSDRPIVLVGNKIDLVRKRRVKKDGEQNNKTIWQLFRHTMELKIYLRIISKSLSVPRQTSSLLLNLLF